MKGLPRPDRPESARLGMARLDDFEASVEALKVAYERYFSGVDRIPPARVHDALKRELHQLGRLRIGSTAVRFRWQSLRARLVTYEHYWTRILHQIERGTFKRVVAEASRRERLAAERRRERARELADAPGSEAGAEHGEREADAPARRSARNSSGPRYHLPNDVDPGEARELFKDFVAAKQALGESTQGLTYSKLIDKLACELPRLRERHGRDIRLEVTTVGGKVRLRARRRREQKAS